MKGQSGAVMDPSTRTSIIGTSMLLAAASIVLLTLVLRGPLWQAHLGSGQRLHETADASKETSRRPIKPSAPPTVAANTSSAPASQTSRTAAADRYRSGADGSSVSIGNNSPAQNAATTRPTSERSSQPVTALRDADPVAATRCVYVYNPGSDPSQWKVENGCDRPVGIFLDSGRSLSLPAPTQRPVTLDEQIVYAGNVHHRACFVSNWTAIYLIGAPSEERSTPEWREQFEAASASDGCLSQLQK
jgi:hypothetical protein